MFLITIGMEIEVQSKSPVTAYGCWTELDKYSFENALFTFGYARIRDDNRKYNVIDKNGNILFNEYFKDLLIADFRNIGIQFFSISTNTFRGYIDIFGYKYDLLFVINNLDNVLNSPYIQLQNYFLRKFPQNTIKQFIFLKMRE